jgi:hypothetical protein
VLAVVGRVAHCACVIVVIVVIALLIVTPYVYFYLLIKVTVSVGFAVVILLASCLDPWSVSVLLVDCGGSFVSVWSPWSIVWVVCRVPWFSAILLDS